tara:strand:+ start:292 stop:588 length:297 start_codon:yes stop_codon:yes gene_type:complete
MKVKDTTTGTTTEIKRHKTTKSAEIPKATAKRAAWRAGHGSVSDDAVPVLRELYKKRIDSLVGRLRHLAEYSKRKTIKSKDVRMVLGAGRLTGVLEAE